MGQKQSKDRLLYQHVVNGNVQGIHALSKQGASLEWKDKDGKTPLIMAAKDPRLYGVAETLIQLGANVNAISRGGTPLHYAAKEGLVSTVLLLLSHGANPFVKNHEHQTPLDVARKNGRSVVVREIESRICYFAGHMRETIGPGFSDVSAPQLSSKVIWVVVVPRSPHNPPKRPKLELVIYSTPQDAGPRRIVFLGRSKLKAPKFDQHNPALLFTDKRSKTRYKFSSVTVGDKQQLRRLYNACKGISQVMPVSAMASPHRTMAEQVTSNPRPTVVTSGRNSWVSAVGSPSPTPPFMTPRNSTAWFSESPQREYSTNWGVTETWQTPPNQSPLLSPVVQKHDRFPAAVASPSPSAPPVNTEEPFMNPVDFSVRASHNAASTSVAVNNESVSSSCVICWEAPVEGACVPCGHVSSCMACLKEIQDANGVCPVCRSDIAQVVKLYGI